MSEGFSDGLAVGEIEGENEGKREGTTVGASEGEIEGRREGLTVGHCDGYLELGTKVGSDDGCSVGAVTITPLVTVVVPLHADEV